MRLAPVRHDGVEDEQARAVAAADVDDDLVASPLDAVEQIDFPPP